MQPADLAHAGTQFDIGAASSHVGGDGDVTAFTGERDDGCLFVQTNGVQQSEIDVALLEHRSKTFAGRDTACADEHGTAGGVESNCFVGNGGPFLFFVGKDAIWPM